MISTLTEELKSRSIHHCNWNFERISRCLALLDEAQIWYRPNEKTLTIGNQVLHLTGNLRQWIIHSLGGETDIRKRSEEFEVAGGIDKAQLLSKLRQVVDDCTQTISALEEEELLRERAVQFFHLSGTAVLLHAVEHFSYHTGQIIQLTKILRNEDLDFYGGKALEATN